MVPIFLGSLEEPVTKPYGLLFLEITLQFLVMESEVRGERRYYCIPEHHAWPEKWSIISLLVKRAHCVQDPPHRNTSALLIPVILSSGVHTIKALPWTKAHKCPCRWSPVGSHQPGCALAWAVLATREGSRTLQDSWVSTFQHKCCHNPTQGACHCILKA